MQSAEGNPNIVLEICATDRRSAQACNRSGLGLPTRAGKEFELTWFKEGRKNMYRGQKGGVWVEHQTSFNMVKPSSFVKGFLRLTDDDWKTLHT